MEKMYTEISILFRIFSSIAWLKKLFVLPLFSSQFFLRGKNLGVKVWEAA
jgi:hypothetical protein